MLGIIASFLIPYLFTHYTWGPDFTDTGQIGDIAGPILNFTGLLIIYFSLQEQLIANKQQAEHFQKEQQRAIDENVIGTAFKIIDDLRVQVDTIRTCQLNNLKSHSDRIISLTRDEFRIPLVLNKHSGVTLRYQKRVSITSVIKDNQYPLVLQRPLEDFEKALKGNFNTIISLLEMLRFSIDRSALSAHHQAVIYNIVYVFYEPLVVEILGGTELFADEALYIDLIVQGLNVIDERISADGEEKLRLERNKNNSIF